MQDTFEYVKAEPFEFKVGDATVRWFFKKLTPLADSSIFAKWGGTAVNVAVLRGEGSEETDFLPLSVEYLEKYYAAGIIASSPYVKREGHPSDSAILKARIIDRAIRPRFPKNLRDVIQVFVSVLSYDPEYDPLLLAFNTTVAALMTSTIPFEGGFVGLKIGLDEKGNPTLLYKDIPLWDENGKHKAQLTDMDMFVAVEPRGVVMVDAFYNEIPEQQVKAAFEFAKSELGVWLNPIDEFVKQYAQAKQDGVMIQVPDELISRIKDDFSSKIADTLQEQDKVLRREKLEALPEEVVSHYLGDEEQTEKAQSPFKATTSMHSGQSAEDNFQYTKQQILLALEKLLKQHVKELVLNKNERLDGRDFNQIRPLYMEVDLLPKVHGSALFKRGDTAVLTTVTLGSLLRQLQLDEMTGEEERRYIHEYYSPPYGFGEPGRYRPYPGRREIGHGALAEKALLPVIPSEKQFPYMVRVVSEVMSSAGSTSMASATASSLALMAAGVPIKRPVAGISIGIIGDEDFESYQLLTDIIEVEDFYGEMDFKVAGTKQGITAIQMDQKRYYIPYQAILEAIDQAKEARLFIFDKMAQVIEQPREQVSANAPKVGVTQVPTDEIGKVIGPGGKIIKDIMEKTATTIHIAEDGTVTVTGKDQDGINKAIEYIQDIVQVGGSSFEPGVDYKIGDILDAEIIDIKPFGAVVRFLDGTQNTALVHISEVADFYIKDLSKVLHIGEQVKVKIIEFDDKGRIRASIKRV